jgi:serine/threonine protein kinase
MNGGDTIGAEAWPNYALPLGTTINGYRIERVLGSGGFGITYLATDLLSQRFAIKEYFPRQFAVRQGQQVVAGSAEDVAVFEECKERFLREAKALVVLSQAAENRGSIVRVQTYFESHGTCFLVMDYLEGANLASVLRQYPDGLPAARLHSVLWQLLSGVRVVHRAGLMHRDIKPANIILRDDDKVVLIDFGATRETATGQATAYTQIYSGGYAPPEQMLGLRQAEYSDIYAIGAVGYRAIGGKPVSALMRQNAMVAGIPDPQPTAERIGSGRYPKKLLATIDAALAIDPARRLKSVDDMLAALGQPIDEEPAIDALKGRGPTPGRRKRLLLWGTAVVVAFIGISIGVGSILLRSNGPKSVTHQQLIPTAPQQLATSAPVAAPNQQPPPPALTAQTQEVPPKQEQPAVPQVAAQGNAAYEPAKPTVPQIQPQQETLSLPPVPPPPRPDVSPLERAQAAAAAVPCAALAVAEVPDGLRVSGFAGAGSEFGRLLVDLREAGNVTNATTPVDQAFCTPIAAIAQAARQGWANKPIAPVINLDRQSLAEGSVLRVNIDSQSPVLLVDLFQTDGTVRHLRTSHEHAQWTATGPPGSRLLTAIASASPLYAGNRPEVEKIRDYLALLRPHLTSPDPSIAANLAIVTVSPASPAVMKTPQRPARSSARCANIVSRAQLGETLSDAELAALRTECRP